MIFNAITDMFNPSEINIVSNLILVLIILVWKLVWYGIAIFKTIERKQIIWFTILLIGLLLLPFDLGLVAIIYLILYKRSNPSKKSKKSKIKKRKRR